MVATAARRYEQRHAEMAPAAVAIAAEPVAVRVELAEGVEHDGGCGPGCWTLVGRATVSTRSG
jgi:hypothetical protein